MRSSWLKRLVMAVGLAVLACCVQAGTAAAQGSMPEGSYICKPLSAENFKQPPPPLPIGDISPEEQAYLDSMKLPPDLCPPGTIVTPNPDRVDGTMKGSPPSFITNPASPEPELTEPSRTKPKAKAKKAKAKAQAKRKKAKAKAKKRRQGKSKTISRR